MHVWRFPMGFVAGLRSIITGVRWAPGWGWLHLENTSLAFLGFAATPYTLSVLAIGEDSCYGFAVRIAMSAMSGAGPRRAPARRWLAGYWPATSFAGVL